ncbi:MAG: c-type cytochrome [Rhizobiaceae bacterium]
MSILQPGFTRLWSGPLIAISMVMGTSAFAQQADKLAAGKALIVENCGACHAVAKDDKGQHPQAPNFRDLSKNYPVAQLEESLAEGIMTGHPDMPVFEFEPDSVDAIIAYLESIQVQ